MYGIYRVGDRVRTPDGKAGTIHLIVTARETGLTYAKVLLVGGQYQLWAIGRLSPA